MGMRIMIKMVVMVMMLTIYVLGVQRDEGMCYFTLKRFAEAAQALQSYLESDKDLGPEAQQRVCIHHSNRIAEHVRSGVLFRFYSATLTHITYIGSQIKFVIQKAHALMGKRPGDADPEP